MTTHKAWVAGLATFLGTLAATLQGRTDLDTMRVVDWIVVVIAAAAAGAAVYTVPNHLKGPAPEARHRPPH